MKDVLLEVSNLKKYFPVLSGILRKRIGDVKAVDDVSFHIEKGETLGLVGESGSGKTTIARSILRAIDPTSGKIMFHGGKGSVDLATLHGRDLRLIRRRMQMIFQDPYASLNPRMTVLELVAEPLVNLRIGTAAEQKERVAELLKVVGLDPRFMSRYPHAFSGGQRQRIGIARALVLNPDLVVCDEPVSALDVSIQAQVLNLVKRLQSEFDLTYLFIAHDLSVVKHLCDRVCVLYVGKIVEVGETKSLFRKPKHPYVEALLSAVPRPDPRYKVDHMVSYGEPADPARRPSGCAFHPRCPYAQDICRTEEPKLTRVDGGETDASAGTGTNGARWSACHFADTLDLNGVGSA